MGWRHNPPVAKINDNRVWAMLAATAVQAANLNAILTLLHPFSKLPTRQRTAPKQQDRNSRSKRWRLSKRLRSSERRALLQGRIHSIISKQPTRQAQ